MTEGPSRRTLMAGAAWAVPVVAVASAAPAYAVSGSAKATVTYSPCDGMVASGSATITADQGTIPAGTSFRVGFKGYVAGGSINFPQVYGGAGLTVTDQSSSSFNLCTTNNKSYAGIARVWVFTLDADLPAGSNLVFSWTQGTFFGVLDSGLATLTPAADLSIPCPGFSTFEQPPLVDNQTVGGTPVEVTYSYCQTP